MSIFGGPKIITDGLVLYWDMAEPDCYPGTGTTINDLCRNYNGTLFNSPTFSTANGGILTFNGSTSYAHNTAANFSTTNCTGMGAAKYNGTNGRMINSYGNNWLMGHWGNSVANFYAEGWITSAAGSGGADTNWRIYTTLNNYSSDSWSFYINGVPNVLASAGGTQGPNGITIGRQGSGAEYSNGSFSFLMIYNRILNASEILQNYNALKGRFNL